MPIADARDFAFKYVNGHPKNTKEGLPTVMAFGVLAEVVTGLPLLLSEMPKDTMNADGTRSSLVTVSPPDKLGIYGEACRLGPARLAAAGVTFRQIPYDVKAR